MILWYYIIIYYDIFKNVKYAWVFTYPLAICLTITLHICIKFSSTFGHLLPSAGKTVYSIKQKVKADCRISSPFKSKFKNHLIKIAVPMRSGRGCERTIPHHRRMRRRKKHIKHWKRFRWGAAIWMSTKISNLAWKNAPRRNIIILLKRVENTRPVFPAIFPKQFILILDLARESLK